MSQTELTLIVIVAIMLVIGLRIWRATREQRIKVGSMWIAPAIFLALTIWALVFDGFTTPVDVALALGLLVVGGAIGWYQGTHTTVRIDRAAHVMYTKAKPIGAAIFVAVIGARLLIRGTSILPAIQNGSVAAGTVPMPPKGDLASQLSALLLALALGVILGLRVYLLRKYQLDAPADG